MSIPVQNIYYLLTYAWDGRLVQQEVRNVDVHSCPNLNTLFARVLNHSVHQLIRRGLDRDYVDCEELTSRVRGRIDFPASARKQTWRQGRLKCVYDELSQDVLHNRIIRSTMDLLHRDRAVCGEVHAGLTRLLQAFGQVRTVPLHPSVFRRVQLHRNNLRYRFVLQLCQLISDSYLPDPEERGRRRFRDILTNEKVMAAVFERFVRGFASRHLSAAKVSAMHIGWDVSCDDPGSMELLPRMKTDVTLQWPDRKMILDCKYYREAIKGQYDGKKLISGHLYQLNAYLTNKAVEPGWEAVEGMLLYPANGIRLDNRYLFHRKHSVRVATLDLNQPWTGIHHDLLELLSKDR